MPHAANGQWRAHLFGMGARSTFVCAADSRERSDAEMDLLEAVVRQLVARAGQRVGASVRRVKAAGKELDPEALAASLGADYVATLDTEVSEERLCISLAIAATARELPSHTRRFEEPAAERLRFVDETAERVLEDVCDLLDERGRQGMRDWGTRSLLAYRHAVAADAHRRSWEFASLSKAEQLYRLALREDSRFESAYLELATVLGGIGCNASDNATRARLMLDLRSLAREAQAHGIADFVIERIEHEAGFLSNTSPLEIEAMARRELGAGALGAESFGTYMRLLCGAGLYDESRRYLDRAIALDSHWRTEECTIAGARGDFDEYIRLLRRDIERSPRDTFAIGGLLRTYAHLGRYSDAEALLEQIRQVNPDHGYSMRIWLGCIRGEYARGSDRLERLLSNPHNVNYNRGLACFIVGDVERGCHFWREIEPVFAHLLWRFITQYEHIWSQGVVADPRYQALLDELGIGQRWKRYLWDRARELTEVTGIPVTSPRPPEHYGNGRVASSTIELLPYGVIGLDASGRVVFANSVAHGLLTARRGLRTLGTNLVAEDTTASAQLREAIARAASSSHAVSEPTLVRCPRRSSVRALQVLVAPAQSTPALALDRAERSARVVVIVSDPDDAPLPDAAVLGRLFDLTPTQARLAAAIASGMTAAEYADEHGVRASTARQQLKELMALVGVHRQAELVRVLMSGVAQLRTVSTG